MKKITLLLFFMAFTFQMSAQLAEEGFEGTWTPYPALAGFGEGNYGPPGWYIRNVAPNGPSKFWTQQASTSDYPAYGGSGHAAFLDRDNAPGTGTNLTEDWLITKQFTLPENAELHFFSRLTLNNNQGSVYDVRMGTDPTDPSTFISLIDSDGWTELEINPVQLDYVEKVIDIAGTAGDQVYIAFIMKGDQMDRWLIDNVKVVSECLAPTESSLTASNFGATTADLSWDNPSGATSWEVEVVADDDVPVGQGVVYTGTLPITVENLTASTCYKFYVRAVCGDGGTSDWIGPENFCTSVCETSEQCTYEFIVLDSYGDGWNGNTMTVSQNGITMATITLEEGTGPETIAVPLCNGQPFELYWNSGGSFASEVGVSIVNPFAQVLYSKDPGEGSQDSLLYSGSVDCDTPACLPVSGLAATNITTTTVDLGWGGLSEGDWEYYVVPAGSPAPSDTDSGVYTATNPVVGVDETTAGEALEPDETYEFYVRVVCDSDTGDYSTWAGPFEFTMEPTCPKPIDVSITDIGLDTATINWTETGSATQWEVYVVEQGSPAPDDTTSGVMVNAAPPFVYDIDLESGTIYDVYVKAICTEDTDESKWSDVVTFNTLICEPEEQCNYTISMTDSFGDGWNGNTMSIIQNGIVVATVGSTFTTGNGPVTAQIPLCPDVEFEVYWNEGGLFASEVGFVLYDAYLEDVYTKPSGTGSPGTTLYTGISTCTPPACPKPQNIVISGVGLDEATFGWTEMGSATTWEYFLLPYGSTAPGPDDVGTTTTDNPLTVPSLDSGTTYQFYVRAICGGEDGNSTWSGPFTFTTLIQNDDCDSPTNVPVNEGVDCIEYAMGTITGATSSDMYQDCMWTTPEYDVWYSFEATSSAHVVSVNNAVGSYFYFAVYEGDDCGDMTQIYCGYDNPGSINNLTVGETYYIMVFTTYFPDPTEPTSFEVCISTPEPPIYVSETDYTVPELIQDVFIGSECAYVDNVEWKTGEDIGSNGIGYFQKNEADFPFDSGIVLVSGDAETNVPGPNDFNSFGGGWENQEIETQLEDILANYPDFTGGPGSTHGSTSIKFDFSPVENIPQGVPLFDFLFASNEYGTPSFECIYSDVFAFILTDLETNESTNLAVLPNGQLILVTNIHPDNGYCEAVNEEYFGQYIPADGVTGAINLNGMTVPMQAFTPYVLEANHEYSMQMIIANEGDDGVSSAIFLLAGSMNLGNVPLGDDLLVENSTALCSGETYTLSSNLDPDIYSFEWYLEGELIDGETGPDLVVSESGEYTLEATAPDTECVREGNVTVEFYPNINEVTSPPDDLAACDDDGYDVFDLGQNNNIILDGVENIEDYVISYHLSYEEAENNENPLPLTYENVVQYQQTVYVRISISDCVIIRDFDLIIQSLYPEFTITEDFGICEGSTGVIEVTPGNFDPEVATYTWTLDDEVLDQTTPSITITEGGVYEVIVNNLGCLTPASVTVTAVPVPVPDVISDVTECDSYQLPVLTVGNYYTGSQATGDALSAGDIITSTQMIYIYAQSAENAD
ncbi:choice-of-anchor L domain-containing protein, partial [Flavobacterium rhizosphaerae]